MSTVAPFNFSGSGSQFWGGASGVRIFPGKKKHRGGGKKYGPEWCSFASKLL
jgi:hypothetical protein